MVHFPKYVKTNSFEFICAILRTISYVEFISDL